MDVLAPITMKNAANCEKQCELQNHNTSDFRMQLAPKGVFASVCITNSNLGAGEVLPPNQSRSSNWRAKLWRAEYLPAPEVKQDDPLDLSISLSGGKEINKDCLSNGE